MLIFNHTCDVGGVRYEAGSDVEESKLPAAWVAEAVEAQFVRRSETFEEFRNSSIDRVLKGLGIPKEIVEPPV